MEEGPGAPVASHPSASSSSARNRVVLGVALVGASVGTYLLWKHFIVPQNIKKEYYRLPKNVRVMVVSEEAHLDGAVDAFVSALASEPHAVRPSPSVFLLIFSLVIFPIIYYIDLYLLFGRSQWKEGVLCSQRAVPYYFLELALTWYFIAR